jgi:hypothetical protein
MKANQRLLTTLFGWIPIVTLVVFEILYFIITGKLGNPLYGYFLGLAISLAVSLKAREETVITVKEKSYRFIRERGKDELHVLEPGDHTIPYGVDPDAGTLDTDDQIELTYKETDPKDPFEVDTFRNGTARLNPVTGELAADEAALPVERNDENKRTLFFRGPIVMTLELPEGRPDMAMILRSKGKTMAEVNEQVQAQLRTIFLDTIAEVIADNFSPEQVHQQTLAVKRKIRREFLAETNLRREYGLEIKKFGLGRIQFSPAIKAARETRQALSMINDGADILLGDMDSPTNAERLSAQKLALTQAGTIKTTVEEKKYDFPQQILSVLEAVAIRLTGGR